MLLGLFLPEKILCICNEIVMFNICNLFFLVNFQGLQIHYTESNNVTIKLLKQWHRYMIFSVCFGLYFKVYINFFCQLMYVHVSSKAKFINYIMFFNF